MKQSSRAHLYVTAITDQGRQRQNNEDRYAVSAHLTGPTNKTPSVLAVICDGIGGHRAGEIAAEIAVEMISSYVAQSDGAQPLQILTRAVGLASDAIYAEAQKDPERSGMGATCVCAWVIGDQLYSASLGDSRLFLLRGDSIQQVSIDHTWVQEAVDAGILTPETAHAHPNVHVIRRYLGAPIQVIPDLRLRLKPGESDEQAMANQGLKLTSGDMLLLCSDGLTDLVQPHEILENLRRLGREEGARALIALANQRAGHDNITVVALEAPPTIASSQIEAPQPRPQTMPKISPQVLIGCAVAIVVLAVIAVITIVGILLFLK